MIQAENKKIWKMKKEVEPQISVKSSEIWVKGERERSDLASKERKNWRLLSEFWITTLVYK